jgi:uncharacterized protein with HEPN domain
MKQRDPGVYLEDIEYYANAAISFVAEYSLEQYLPDEFKQTVRIRKLWRRPRRATRQSR